ncbi:MAG: hypothetical protein ACOYXT_26175, partial [Bacteroidota bacterium]
QESVIGRGFNGLISGYTVIAKKLIMEGFEMTNIPAGITISSWHNYASIGMQVLKDYAVVINYCKSYVCFKRL